jgi:outer membrane protein OmpA-like peptidoglycan-associated protein
MRLPRGTLLSLGVVLLASCGGSDGGGAAGVTPVVVERSTTAATDTSTAPTTVGSATTTTGSVTTATDPTTTVTTATTAADATVAAEEAATTLPAGAQPGLFDFNDDGTNEPTCGTADFQAGLIVRTYCDDLAGYANTPEAGATLVPGALYGIPGPPDDPRDTPITSGASVSPQHLQSATDGREVVVYTMSSDTVFAASSDQLHDPARASLSVIAAGILQSYPGATLQVRGNSDSRGSPDSNQALSERRAAAVAGFFVEAGFDPADVSSVGLGQTQPNYADDTEVGRDQNRRIELVVRPS